MSIHDGSINTWGQKWTRAISQKAILVSDKTTFKYKYGLLFDLGVSSRHTAGVVNTVRRVLTTPKSYRRRAVRDYCHRSLICVEFRDIQKRRSRRTNRSVCRLFNIIIMMFIAAVLHWRLSATDLQHTHTYTPSHTAASVQQSTASVIKSRNTRCNYFKTTNTANLALSPTARCCHLTFHDVIVFT